MPRRPLLASVDPAPRIAVAHAAPALTLGAAPASARRRRPRTSAGQASATRSPRDMARPAPAVKALGDRTCRRRRGAQRALQPHACPRSSPRTDTAWLSDGGPDVLPRRSRPTVPDERRRPTSARRRPAGHGSGSGSTPPRRTRSRPSSCTAARARAARSSSTSTAPTVKQHRLEAPGRQDDRPTGATPATTATATQHLQHRRARAGSRRCGARSPRPTRPSTST